MIDEHAADPRSTVVERSRSQAVIGLFFVPAICALCLLRLTSGGIESAGEVVGTIILVVFTALSLWLAIWMTRITTSLLVTPDLIRLETSQPVEMRACIRRVDTDTVVLMAQRSGTGVHQTTSLSMTDPQFRTLISLNYFKRDDVDPASRRAGWIVLPPLDSGLPFLPRPFPSTTAGTRDGDRHAARRDVIAALDEVAERLRAANADLTRASFTDQAEAVAEVQAARDHVRRTGEVSSAVTVLFLPTGPLQEAAIDSGWGDRFLELAAVIDDATR